MGPPSVAHHLPFLFYCLKKNNLFYLVDIYIADTISILHQRKNTRQYDFGEILCLYRNDELGVPYTVVLSDETLDTGVISIRSRDTRLKVSVCSPFSTGTGKTFVPNCFYWQPDQMASSGSTWLI